MREVARRCVWCDEPQVKVGTSKYRILEMLTSDMGFSWTSREVSNRLDMPFGTARKELQRLADEDVITVRRHRTPNGWRLRYSARYKTADRSWPPTLVKGFMCSCGEFLANPHDHPIRIILDAHKRGHLNGTAP